MANFDVQIQALSGTATQTEMDDWATDGVKEIINILPYELKIECATMTALTSSTPMDLDITGEVFHVTRENADAGYHTPCRKIPSMYGGLAEDSSNLMFYGTATDPVYWTESDTGGDPKLFVKPTPTANQPARVHHVAFPSVNVSDVSAIVNFPNEAEYLVVLYAAIKVLQNKMNEMNAVSAIDTTAFTYIKAAVDQAETACNKFANASSDSQFETDVTWDAANSQLRRVDDALAKAQNLIDGTTMNGDTEPQSAQYWLNDEDTEMVAATLQTAQTEIKRAQIHISEWVSVGDMRVKEVNAALSEAQGYIGEAKIRMEREGQKYQWYQAQQQQIQQDYDKGLQMLIAGNMPQVVQPKEKR